LSVERSTLGAVGSRYPDELTELLDRQLGVVTRRQAYECGLTRSAVGARIESGRWQRIHKGVYATFSGRPSRDAQLWAAVLSAGPGAMLSYWTAAELGGLLDKPGELIHVTVPADRRIARTAGIALHRSDRALSAVHPSRLLPQTRIEETVLDLANVSGTLDNAVGWLTRSLQRRLTTQDKLRAALEQRAKIRWRARLVELLTADAAGLHSILEVRYRRDVECPHGLPRSSRQARYRQGGHNEYRDILYDAYRTAVELDGTAAHPADERWRDVRRDNAAAAAGIITVRYGWLDITARPCAVAAQVSQVLRDHGYTGARACSPGCAVGEVVRTYCSPLDGAAQPSQGRGVSARPSQ
jgi:predicted transcriptional regulator of viral defense system